jgi:hypothetical protein
VRRRAPRLLIKCVSQKKIFSRFSAQKKRLYFSRFIMKNCNASATEFP